jgi:hypothetical protein
MVDGPRVGRHRRLAALAPCCALVCLVSGYTPVGGPLQSPDGLPGGKPRLHRGRERLATPDALPVEIARDCRARRESVARVDSKPERHQYALWMPTPPLGSLSVMVWETWERAHLPLPPAARRTPIGRVAPVALDTGLLTSPTLTAAPR